MSRQGKLRLYLCVAHMAQGRQVAAHHVQDVGLGDDALHPLLPIGALHHNGHAVHTLGHQAVGHLQHAGGGGQWHELVPPTAVDGALRAVRVVQYKQVRQAAGGGAHTQTHTHLAYYGVWTLLNVDPELVPSSSSCRCLFDARV
jgi:hypothetical protein